MSRPLLASLLLCLLVSCGDQDVASTKPANSILGVSPGSLTVLKTFEKTPPEGALFEEVASSSGVTFVNPINKAHPLSPLYGSDFGAGGIAVGDVDGDGMPDLYLTCGLGANRLYHQKASFQFEDITASAGVALADVCSAGASMADVNGDGHLDLFVCVYDAPNRLFMNDGTGKFTDMAESAGVAWQDASLSAHFQDYDQDGDLDFYLVTNRIYPAGNLPLQIAKGRKDRLYQNDGTGKFQDVSEKAGLSGEYCGVSASWLDYDQDGDLDLYVANTAGGPDRLYQNQGDGTFRDVIQDTVPYSPSFSRGSDTADMNNDGFMDLLVLGSLNAQLSRNAYFLNSGTGRFLESAHLSGLGSTDHSWAVKLADFDNDSYSDVFITNTMKPNMAYRNRDGFHFDKVGKEWGLDHKGGSYAAAWADFDRDGNLDLVVHHMDENVSLYRHRGSDSSRVLISLRGLGKNVHGIGSKVTARTGNQTRTGFMSSNDPVIHFGLGDAAIIDQLTVTWPSGTVQVLTGVKANAHLLIAEPLQSISNERVVVKPLFQAAEDENLSVAKHTEQPYDDFAVQPSLPNKLSQLGPGVAVEDMDGDGDDDVIFGTARGEMPHAHFNHAGQLLIGYFKVAQYDALCEDMAPLLFDADADGDLDWYAVSGGVETGDADHLLQDRLYVQERPDRFVKANTAMPPIRQSGGGAAAADFDRDGDLDLVVTGRFKPGEYPLSPGSTLLRNDTQGPNKPLFTDQTEGLAPGLKTIEMATSALWSDANQDGWVDLLVTTEWGPVRLFLNREGRLEDATASSGLAEALGRWHGIAGRDFDNDGDIDYVATNFGENITETYSEEALALSRRFEITTVSTSLLINDGQGKFTVTPLPSLAQLAPGFGVVATEVNGDGHADIYLVQNFFTPQGETGKMAGGLSALLLGNGKGGFQALWPNQSGLVVPGDAKGLATMDFNADGWVDFVVTNNNAHPQVFLNVAGSQSTNTPVTVVLQGSLGNRKGIGAQVSLVSESGKRQTAEVYAGGGYLSQSSSQLHFGSTTEDPAAKVEVRWPDGSNSEAPITNEGRLFIVKE